jgi:threonine/homoserine/homoserine lactone efflux protein
MNNAKNVGFKKAVKFNFGILVGSLLVMGLCLAFSSILFNLVPKIQFPMKILGAAYLLYLIVKTLLPPKEHKTINANGSFVIGIVLQLINPKLILFGITVMSSYILPYYKELPVLIMFVVVITIIGFTATLCWALFGSLFSVLFFKHKKMLDIIMALLLLYCAISLFL